MVHFVELMVALFFHSRQNPAPPHLLSRMSALRWSGDFSICDSFPRSALHILFCVIEISPPPRPFRTVLALLPPEYGPRVSWSFVLIVAQTRFQLPTIFFVLHLSPTADCSTGELLYSEFSARSSLSCQPIMTPFPLLSVPSSSRILSRSL